MQSSYVVLLLCDLSDVSTLNPLNCIACKSAGKMKEKLAYAGPGGHLENLRSTADSWIRIKYFTLFLRGFSLASLIYRLAEKSRCIFLHTKFLTGETLPVRKAVETLS